jgi:hypothetical protein
MDLKSFFAPSWKKIGWFFLVFFVAQLYTHVIISFVPTALVQNFINFILNPAYLLLGNSTESLMIPITLTINAMWQYFLATLLAKEISKEK